MRSPEMRGGGGWGEELGAPNSRFGQRSSSHLLCISALGISSLTSYLLKCGKCSPFSSHFADEEPEGQREDTQPKVTQ